MSYNRFNISHKGFVIIGYPGIGKTSAASSFNNIIDLESNAFDKESSNWTDSYCETAYHLADQGYSVFVSSHKEVVDKLVELREYYPNITLIAIIPSLKLKNEWVNKLYIRASSSIKNRHEHHKNVIAYNRVLNFYEKDIIELSSHNEFSIIFIENTWYNLVEIIHGIRTIYDPHINRRVYCEKSRMVNAVDDDTDDDLDEE